MDEDKNIVGWIISIMAVLVPIGLFVYKKRDASKENVRKNIFKKLDDFSELTNEYWNLEINKQTKIKANALESKITGHIKNITGEVRYYNEKFAGNIDWVSLMGNISDAATNGNFGGNRKPDPQRYIIIVNTIESLRNVLRK